MESECECTVCFGPGPTIVVEECPCIILVNALKDGIDLEWAIRRCQLSHRREEIIQFAQEFRRLDTPSDRGILVRALRAFSRKKFCPEKCSTLTIEKKRNLWLETHSFPIRACRRCYTPPSPCFLEEWVDWLRDFGISGK